MSIEKRNEHFVSENDLSVMARHPPSPLCYGSIRAALSLGPDGTTRDGGESEGSTTMRETVWRRPEMGLGSRAEFWEALNGRSEASVEDLRGELVSQSRAAMKSSILARKQCAARKQVEQHLTEVWRQAAGGTTSQDLTPLAANNTPHQVAQRTPDPLHSPYPQY